MKGIEQVGGIPVLLPLTDDSDDISQLADTFDGFLFSGGPDIHPEIYGEFISEGCGEISKQRDDLELFLIKLLLERNKPIFGICRGVQVINVGMGGTLIQDIPTEYKTAVNHSQEKPYHRAVHSVTLSDKLAEMLGESDLNVNSMHHQSIKKLAPQLKIGARSPDGIIEAAYSPDYKFVLGVQWHPEHNLEWHSSNRLFSSFVNACQK